MHVMDGPWLCLIQGMYYIIEYLVAIVSFSYISCYTFDDYIILWLQLFVYFASRSYGLYNKGGDHLCTVDDLGGLSVVVILGPGIDSIFSVRVRRIYYLWSGGLPTATKMILGGPSLACKATSVTNNHQ